MCSAPRRSEGDRISVAAASGMAAWLFQKIVLDNHGTMSYISPVPSAGGRSREASLGWDGSGACGRGHANPGLGRRRPIRGCPAYWGPPPSDPTAVRERVLFRGVPQTSEITIG